jgi:FAD-dependent oxidoreductase domain-containing protein 1
MAETRIADVAIIGGAIMGSAAAFWLAEMARKPMRILVIEADPAYSRASTALSVASIRQQFSTAINVQISRFGIEFLKNIKEFMGLDDLPQSFPLTENGYLFLAGSAETEAAMRRAVAVQRGQGAATELLDPAALAARFPWLALDDVRLGSFGPTGEGWFDNMSLLNAFRQAARARGVRYLSDRVVDIERSGDRLTRLRLASGDAVSVGAVVNAAGTRAADLLRLLGEDLPVEPRKRTVFLIDAPGAHHPGAPLLVDHSGFYLRPEGKHWLTAIVPDTDGPAHPDDFEPDWWLFEEMLWPRLFARAPAFDAVKVVRSWAGHYAFNTLDQNAILGRHPRFGNFYLMNGFSGHGLQQAPAVGRGIAELILTGDYQSLDLTALGFSRIEENRPFREEAIV